VPLNAAPTLETERLILRSSRISDLDPVWKMWCEPQVYKFIAGKPSTVEDSWRGILRDIGQWQLLGFGLWVLEEKSTGLLVGEAGYLDCKRDVTPSMNDTPEMGWVLSSAYHGKGFATEALRKIAEWGDRNLTQDVTACIIDPGNTASLRVAKKLGFKEIAQTTYKNEPTLLLHRLRDSL
jgi:RimJ/RimL family protein N-acetyltransferase